MDSKQACQAWLQQHHQQQQFAERVLEHLAFNSDVLDRWTHIGSAQGLTTDLDVATFLIQHYENTWDRATPPQFCLTCHSPLTFLCTKCCAVNPPNPAGAAASPDPPLPHSHDIFPGFFSPGDNNGAPYASDKGKKRKKGGRRDLGGGDVGVVDGLVENDDELLGLYIQFGQPPGSSAPLGLAHHPHHPHLHSAALPPLSDSSPRKKKNNGSGKSPGRKRASRGDGEGGDGTPKALKSYVCTHCGKTIYKLSDFKKHVRTHTREKPYQCQFCQAAFSDASSAARHRRVHTGEKPFPCLQCPAAFAQSSDLTKHRRVHTLERPWQCHICLKTFSDSSRFAHHRRQHQKETGTGRRAAGGRGKGEGGGRRGSGGGDGGGGGGGGGSGGDDLAMS